MRVLLTYRCSPAIFDCMKLAHLSDLHVGRRASHAKMEALSADIKLQAPKLLIVSGDITDQGYKRQFRRALNFLQSLEIPFISVPGNREVCPAAFWEWMFPWCAMRRYSRFFGDKDRVLYLSHQHKIVFFGLNSVHPFPSWPGAVTRKSRYWLKEQASGFDGYFKGLFLHHPVLPVIGSSSFWAHSFTDAGEILNICTQNNISLILQGHKHRSAVMELSVPSRTAKVIVSSCGAPLMPYWDSTYHIVDISHSSIVVQPREYRDGSFCGDEPFEFSRNGPPAPERRPPLD